jgi:hypothetical protein
MGIGDWFLQNGFNLLSAGGVITGLWFTAYSLRSDTKTKRIANLLTITANHRELWKEYLNNPNLARVRDTVANTTKHPVTDQEHLFVIMVILHINTAYYAMGDDLVIKLEGLRRDVAQIFARPVPKEVWEKVKQFQNDDFVKFVESVLK